MAEFTGAPSDSQLPELAALGAAKSKNPEKSVDTLETHVAPFNVNDIPSPTRSRAKRQHLVLVEANSSCKSTLDDSLHEVHCACQVMETREAQKGAAVKMDEGEEEDETKKRMEKNAHIEVEEERLRTEIQRRVLMSAMDKVCVDTFLASVKHCAWRESVRTPIKGTNLYTKHMRPARPVGTSVDVKESSFRNLGAFLNFLEDEGLLCLQPGLTDPVVTWINFEACRKYVYIPRSKPPLVQ